jgi:hypothetical protein
MQRDKSEEPKRGLLFKLEPELVTSLFHAAKVGAPRLRRRHDMALSKIKAEKLKRLQMAKERALKAKKKTLFVAWITSKEVFQNDAGRQFSKLRKFITS